MNLSQMKGLGHICKAINRTESLRYIMMLGSLGSLGSLWVLSSRATEPGVWAGKFTYTFHLDFCFVLLHSLFEGGERSLFLLSFFLRSFYFFYFIFFLLSFLIISLPLSTKGYWHYCDPECLGCFDHHF